MRYLVSSIMHVVRTLIHSFHSRIKLLPSNNNLLRISVLIHFILDGHDLCLGLIGVVKTYSTLCTVHKLITSYLLL